MLASEIRAAVYIINRANRQFGLNMDIPTDIITQPFTIKIDRILHSAITGLPLVIGGSHARIAHHVKGEPRKITISDGWWMYPTGGRGRRVQTMILHALDGIDLGDNAAKKAKCIMNWVGNLIEDNFVEERWQIDAILEQVTRERALRAELAALRAELDALRGGAAAQ